MTKRPRTPGLIPGSGGARFVVAGVLGAVAVVLLVVGVVHPAGSLLFVGVGAAALAGVALLG